jgi:hypothetical protein
MVLLPGCSCCCPCGFADNISPTSVELDLECEDAFSLSVTYVGGTFEYTFLDATGTYSLSLFSGSAVGCWPARVYRYEDVLSPLLEVSLETRSGSYPYAAVIDARLPIRRQLAGGSAINTVLTSLSCRLVDSCGQSASRVRWVESITQATLGADHATDITASYDANCSLPATIAFRQWITNGTASIVSTTFPHTKTESGYSFVGVDVSFRVLAMRYVWATRTESAFLDVGQTVCDPPA